VDEAENKPEVTDNPAGQAESVIEGKTPRLLRRVKGGNVLQLVGVGSPSNSSSTEMFMVHVLLLVMRDKATRLYFEPWEFKEAEAVEGYDKVGLRMLYEIQGEQLQLEPPPPWCRPWIARQIESVARLKAISSRLAHRLRRLANWLQGRGPAPRWGRFRVAVGEVHYQVDVWSWRVALGDSYDFQFEAVTEEVSEVAGQELLRLTRIQDERRAEEQTASGLMNS
jgi:hypothetical protein